MPLFLCRASAVGRLPPLPSSSSNGTAIHCLEVQHVPVADAPDHRCQQFRIRNAAKVIGEVGVYDASLSSAQQTVNVPHRVVRAATLCIRILLRLQTYLEDRR
jgi:hypothetical protein